jgi:hypothetical protein
VLWTTLVHIVRPYFIKAKTKKNTKIINKGMPKGLGRK